MTLVTLQNTLPTIWTIACLVIVCLAYFQRAKPHIFLWAAAGLSLLTFGLPLLSQWPQTPLLGIHGKPIGADWAAFWLAAEQTAQFKTAQAYDTPNFLKAFQEAFGKEEYFAWQYPPTTSLALTPLTLLPYGIGALIWLLGPALWLLVTLCRTFPSNQTDPPVIAIALACPALLINLAYGQTGALIAVLMLLATTHINARPHLSGTAMGLIWFKPHFGVLLPFAVIGARAWKTGLIAGSTIVLWLILSLIHEGLDPWRAWISALIDAPSRITKEILGGPFTSWYAFVTNLTGQKAFGYGAQILSAAVAITAIVLVFQKSLCPHIRLAVLTTGALTVSPYTMFYDWVLIVPAVIVLTRSTAIQDLRIASLLGITPLFPLLMWESGSINGLIHSGGPLASIIFFLTLRRALQAMKHDQETVKAGVAMLPTSDATTASTT
ncbi:hypothetical protein PbB2_02833 [Candidatus Phycosocius bacilliformis]|uniref:DUF2029 domain-containing protein n=1 Tax=Candidatus Phycosocius bacilliformis TaxID=1445552 RepID=A0A2P2EDM4_9PROT|nr:glycosyltransferase family 87 protein [Candidatus Phycosocius bacilliformis]GBF59141.1 hypothetical protein PbB2_02833 [Candidatus Phycosocius bacilliformis]